MLRTFGRANGIDVAAFRSANDFFAAYAPERPSCLVLDVTPRVGDLAVLDWLRARHEPIAVVAVAAKASVRVAVHALKAGALSFIEKPLDDGELVANVRLALEHSARSFHRERQRCTFERQLARLTARQREVLCHIVLGKANKLIACHLGISERTVEVHRHRLLRTMCVSSAVELALLAGAFDSVGEPEILRAALRQRPDITSAGHGEGETLRAPPP
jgi:FixJ family two-component response regulator